MFHQLCTVYVSFASWSLGLAPAPALDRQALELDQAREASAAEARRAKQALRQKWDDMDEPDAECADSVDVLIRLPSGQRLRRRFPTSTPIAGRTSIAPLRGFQRCLPPPLAATFGINK